MNIGAEENISDTKEESKKSDKKDCISGVFTQIFLGFNFIIFPVLLSQYIYQDSNFLAYIFCFAELV